jgi:hypothetical protein
VDRSSVRKQTGGGLLFGNGTMMGEFDVAQTGRAGARAVRFCVPKT